MVSSDQDSFGKRLALSGRECYSASGTWDWASANTTKKPLNAFIYFIFGDFVQIRAKYDVSAV
jgi:hypothetical protein